MFDSRRGLLDDRLARTQRQIEDLDRFGTERQKRILPALRGQISADRRRLAELETERQERLESVHSTLPSHYLRLLGIAVIVRAGGLTELVT
jgi:hypothetical protein